FFQAAFSLTRATRLFDDVTNATAARTSLGDLEKSAGADYLPSTAANGTINAACPRLSPRASAFIADIQFSDFDFFFRAECGFLERDLHVVPQIRPTLSIFVRTGDLGKKRFKYAAANSSSAAEDFAENVERIVEAATETATCPKGSVTKAIVGHR